MSEQDYRAVYEHYRAGLRQLHRALPETMGAFAQLHRQATRDGVLSAKTKELIALGIAIAARCSGCIAFHVHDALRAGASAEEITETIGVAVLMGGGPAAMYGVEALRALEQLRTATP
ncbi:MAG: alkyl hydroperoxide reductase AhpD [Candidatus Tectimicrobiota bacterium]|nr:MAG: alkyl hydroperoxide reductase AhpD [Candidatus Tectomicrobia bacterium]